MPQVEIEGLDHTLDFPDDTPPEVIQRTVKKITGPTDHAAIRGVGRPQPAVPTPAPTPTASTPQGPDYWGAFKRGLDPREMVGQISRAYNAPLDPLIQRVTGWNRAEPRESTLGNASKALESTLIPETAGGLAEQTFLPKAIGGVTDAAVQGLTKLAGKGIPLLSPAAEALVKPRTLMPQAPAPAVKPRSPEASPAPIGMPVQSPTGEPYLKPPDGATGPEPPPQGIVPPEGSQAPISGIPKEDPISAATVGPYSGPSQRRAPAVTTTPSGTTIKIPKETFTSVKDILDGVLDFGRDLADGVARRVAPRSRGPLAMDTAETLSAWMGQRARQHEIFQTRFADQEAYVDRLPGGKVARYEFMHQMETPGPAGIASIKDPLLRRLAIELQHETTKAYDELVSLGEASYQNFRRNYLGHLWKDPDKAERFYATPKRPFTGNEGHRRFYDTVQDGIEAGLKPVSDNAVTMSLRRLDQMYKAINGHKAWNELREKGNAVRFRPGARRMIPENWTKFDDKVANVFSPASHPVKEAFDKGLMDSLNGYAKDLGLTHERKLNMGNRMGEGVWGYTGPKMDKVVSRFGGPETVVTHEIGHQLDFKYGLAKVFSSDRPAWEELKDLALLRSEGVPDGKYKAYLLNPSERIANLVHAYVHAPDLLADVAPSALARLRLMMQHDPLLAKLDHIKPSLILHAEEKEGSGGGMVKRWEYWGPDEAVAIFNNHLSPGLGKSALYRGIRNVFNSMNMAELGFSGFHANFVLFDTMGSMTSLGLRQMLAGKLGEGLKTLATVPYQAGTSLRLASKVRQEYRAPGTHPDLAPIANAIAEGGGRIRLGQEYTMGDALQHAVQAARQGDWLAFAGHSIPATFEAVSWPIMHYLVPMAKTAVQSRMLMLEMQKNPNMTPAQLRTASRIIMDNVDDRLGQVTYENMYQDGTFKDLMHITLRAYGWTLGSARLVYGASKDTGIYLTSLAKGSPKEVSEKMTYFVGAMVTTALMGYVYHRAMTGERPKEARDLFFPGEEGHRVSMPSYFSKDIPGTIHDPQREATAKLNPGIQAAVELWNNRDYQGAALTDPYAGLDQRFADYAKHIASKYVPISAHQYLQRREAGESIAESAKSFVGLTQAPSWAQDPDTSEAQRAKHLRLPVKKYYRNKAKEE